MAQRVYIETTIIGYLAGRPSRDNVILARQNSTRQWWNVQRQFFDVFISDLVIAEIEQGDPTAVAERQAVITGIPKVDVTDEARRIGRSLIGPSLLPARADQDALHLATAAVHGMEFLLTWNLRHLANAQIAKAAYNHLRGLYVEAPLICTPDALQGRSHDVGPYP